MRIISNVLIAATLGLTTLSAWADRVVVYTIDPNNTQVRFTWRDGGITTSGGVFKTVSGTIWGNMDHPELSRAEVVMQVKSLDTKYAVLNNLLIKSGELFKSEQFPEVTFKSKAITDGDVRKGMFTIVGDLTVNGITKPVILLTKLDMRPPSPPYVGAQSVGFEANTSFLRSDFNMGKYAPFVSDELKVNIKVQAIETVAYLKVQRGVMP